MLQRGGLVLAGTKSILLQTPFTLWECDNQGCCMGAHSRRAICLTMACIPELGCSLLRKLIQHLLPGVAWLEPGRRPPSLHPGPQPARIYTK